MSDHEPLRKWNSCKDHLRIPSSPRSAIVKLHIYDFDNTLYCSPHPNRQLYTDVLYNRLYNSPSILDGGWWSEPSFLEQSFSDMLTSGEGQQAEYWNQDIVKLAHASYEDPHTISIVLTGRKEHCFQATFNEMFSSFGRVSFNAVCLKRENVGSSTAEYKKALINEFLGHYSSLQELVIYEDRLAQAKQFRKAFPGAKVVDVQPRFKMLQIDEETRLVSEIFARSGMGDSLSWTPKRAGFIVDHSSHKKLVGWTFRFFRKKYRMSLLPQWPTYIPVAVDTDVEIARILSNDDPATVQSPEKVEDIANKFYSLPLLQGNREFQFDVFKIGYLVPSKNRGKINIFYKVVPSDTGYVSSSSRELLLYSTDAIKNPSKAPGVRWATLDKRIRVKTTLGHTEKLTYVPGTQEEERL